MNDLKRYAEDRLSKFIGKDMSLDSNQIQFCHDFRKCLEHFYYHKDTVVTHNGMAVTGATFEGSQFIDRPMLIHSHFFQ